MNRVERVNAALRGEQVDHVPVSFWGHSYLREWSSEGLAGAMLDSYRAHNWDFIKVNPRASYHVEDWGAKLQPSGDANRGPTFVDVPVKGPADWRRIGPLDPVAGVLGEQLAALRLVNDALGGDAWFVQTVFSPLSVAKYLVGNKPGPVVDSIREHPEDLKQALETITETFAAYARACIDAGAAGIFFATTGWATRAALSQEEYLRFGREYDLRVLAAVQDGAPFNILHNCGADIYFDLLADYPVSAMSWASTLPGNPTLAEGMRRTRAAVMGGVNEKTTLADGTPAEVEAEVRQAIQQTGGRHVLIAPGCSIPPRTPPANLNAASRAVREVSH